MNRNVGRTDRLARAGLSAVAGVVALAALAVGQRWLAVVAGLSAVGLAFNAVTCFCGINAALGIDTTSDGE